MSNRVISLYNMFTLVTRYQLEYGVISLYNMFTLVTRYQLEWF
jgi:hypothetical protein